MIRVSVLYPYEEGATFNSEYYAQNHMPMVKDRLSPAGLVRAEVDKVIGGGNPKTPPPMMGLCHLYFNSVEDFQQAMGAHGKEIMSDIPNYTSIQPQIQISEVVEV